MDIGTQIKKHWFFTIIGIAVVCIGTTWSVANDILVKPKDVALSERDKRIEQLEKAKSASFVCKDIDTFKRIFGNSIFIYEYREPIS